MVQNLIATIEAFSSSASRIVRDLPYRNKKGVWGISIVLWHAEHYHMLSISNCSLLPTQNEIVNLLRSVAYIAPGKWGFYDNKKGALGYYATFQSMTSFDGGEHWYMLARSNDRKTLSYMKNDGEVPHEIREMIEYFDDKDSDIRL